MFISVHHVHHYVSILGREGDEDCVQQDSVSTTNSAYCVCRKSSVRGERLCWEQATSTNIEERATLPRCAQMFPIATTDAKPELSELSYCSRHYGNHSLRVVDEFVTLEDIVRAANGQPDPPQVVREAVVVNMCPEGLHQRQARVGVAVDGVACFRGQRQRRFIEKCPQPYPWDIAQIHGVV